MILKRKSLRRIKEEATREAAKLGHSIGNFYHTQSGDWVATCGYMDHKTVIIEPKKDGSYEAWGDALDDKC
jgi:hypothetical protein